VRYKRTKVVPVSKLLEALDLNAAVLSPRMGEFDWFMSYDMYY
jgi:hypothetical protein